MKHESWKMKLMGRIAPDLAREIDVYEMQLELRRRGELDEQTFASVRKRRGVFARPKKRKSGPVLIAGRGVRPDRAPGAPWDEPGVQRVQIPADGLRPEHLDAIADVAEEYAGGVARLNTRREIELDFVHIEDTPDLMRRLASANLTTRRGRARVHASALAGVCSTELFDVTPHTEALVKYLANTKDGRARIEIALAGSEDDPSNDACRHDLGFVAAERAPGQAERAASAASEEDGRRIHSADDRPRGGRGFSVYAGGRIGVKGSLLLRFIPEQELLPFAHAACRLVLENKQSMDLLAIDGSDELARRLVRARAQLPFDPRWSSYLAGAHQHRERLLRATEPLAHIDRASNELFEVWRNTNVRTQKQPGFMAASISLPGGHLSARQARKLADLVRRLSGDHLRPAIDRSLVMRWISDRDVRALYDELTGLGLGRASA